MSTPSDLDTRIRNIVSEETSELKEKVDEVHKLMVRLEGASYLAKLLFFIVAPIVGALVWVKDHIKL
jgi:hypothetical protein